SMAFAVLYLSFGILDYFQYPDQWIFFLQIRAAFMPVPFLVYFISERLTNARQSQALVCAHAAVATNLITLMIYFTGDGPKSVYAGGINLVAMIGLSITMLEWHYFIVCAALIFVPYYVLSFHLYSNDREMMIGLLPNTFYFIGTIFTCAVLTF